MASTHMRNALKSAAGALGVLTGAYASYVGMTWLRYGHPAPAGADDVDPLLDQFMPVCEVAERHHIHVAAVTQPWKANVVFRSLLPHEFAAFDEPDYVKIVWTLRADPVGAHTSIFRTETRAVATDSTARAKFRRYWSFLSPGIILIRWASLKPLRSDAERRPRSA